MSDNLSRSVWDDKFLLPLLPLGTEKGCADEPSIVLEEKVALDVRVSGGYLARVTVIEKRRGKHSLRMLFSADMNVVEG